MHPASISPLRNAEAHGVRPQRPQVSCCYFSRISSRGASVHPMLQVGALPPLSMAADLPWTMRPQPGHSAAQSCPCSRAFACAVSCAWNAVPHSAPQPPTPPILYLPIAQPSRKVQLTCHFPCGGSGHCASKCPQHEAIIMQSPDATGQEMRQDSVGTSYLCSRMLGPQWGDQRHVRSSGICRSGDADARETPLTGQDAPHLHQDICMSWLSRRLFQVGLVLSPWLFPGPQPGHCEPWGQRVLCWSVLCTMGVYLHPWAPPLDRCQGPLLIVQLNSVSRFAQ